MRVVTTAGKTFVALSAAVLGAALIEAQQTAAPPARSFDVVEKSIGELQQAMQSGAATSKVPVEAYLARLRAYDKAGPALNTMIVVNPKALDAAAALDRERSSGRVRGPLHGIPILIKDNFETADMPTTAGSIALAGFETRRDAFQVKKLRDAG